MSPLRFFTAEDPDMAWVRAIRRQVFVQDLGVPEQQEFDAADLPRVDFELRRYVQRGMRHLPMELTGAALRRLLGENDHDEEEK